MAAGRTGSELGATTDALSEVESPMSPMSLCVSLSEFGLERRKLTTLFFFLRDMRVFRPAPRARPVVAEFRLTRDGREDSWPLSTLPVSVKVYVVEPPCTDWARIRLGAANGDVRVASSRSIGAAQARTRTSWIPGVNNDKVRCESLKAPRRTKFFCENSEWVSEPSKDKDDNSFGSSTWPFASTASAGRAANGSIATSSSSFSLGRSVSSLGS